MEIQGALLKIEVDTCVLVTNSNLIIHLSSHFIEPSFDQINPYLAERQDWSR